MQSSVFIPPSPNWCVLCSVFWKDFVIIICYCRYGSQLSSVQGNELAYCAQNAIVLLDIEGGLGIKDIIGGYSSRTTCVIHVKDDCGGLFLVTSVMGRSVHVWKWSDDGYCRHRTLTKRPAEIRAMASDNSGMVLVGDKNGNIFVWGIVEPGSKMKRLPECKRNDEIVSMVCCPEGTVTIVGVGYKSGCLALCDYDRGVVLASLDVFDSEIQCVAWSADSSTSGSHLIAVGSKSGLIKVVKVLLDSVETCNVVACLDNMYSPTKKSSEVGNTSVANRFWASLAWMSHPEADGMGDTHSYLISSSLNGRILVWRADDIVQGGECIPCAKLPESHTRAVFSVQSCRLGNQVFVTSTGLDRICTLWNVPVGKSRIEWSQAKIASRCVGLGGHPTSICITRDGDRLIGGIGCGDGTIRIGSCVSMEKILRDDTMTLLWKGIPAPVVVVSWYPAGHEVLAFGCEDGTVGIVNMATKKVQLGISRHQMAVATLVWIPQDDGMFLLQSWCTAGVILTWPHHEEIFAAADVASKDYRTIETLFIGNQDSESPISCIVALHAGCDGRVVIGHTDGLISMCQCTAGLPRILWEYQPIPDNLGTHGVPSIIMVSACGESDAFALTDDGLLFSCSGLSSEPTSVCRVAENFGDTLPTSISVMYIHSKLMYVVAIGFESGIIGLYCSRSAHQDGQALCFVDKFKGHSAPVLQCQWIHSQKEDDQIVTFVTTSQDQSVRVWRVDTEKCLVDDVASAQSSPESDIENAAAAAAAAEFNKSKSKAKLKDTSTSLTTLLPPLNRDSEQKMTEGMRGILETFLHPDNDHSSDVVESLRNHVFEEQSGDIISDLPLSATGIDAYVSKCATALVDSGKTLTGDQLAQRRAIFRAAALKLWQGDVGDCVKLLIETDCLTSDFVSFAAAAGRDAWVLVVRAYVEQLEKKGDIHLGALYLLTIGDIKQACVLYEKHRLLREAATLATTRLPSAHPVSLRVRRAYACHLRDSGDLTRACMLFAVLNDTKEVASLMDKIK